MAHAKLLQISQVHCFHGELVDHPLLKFILVILTRFEVDYPCGR